MRHLYVPPSEITGGTIVLPDPEAHHARTVLRSRVGDRFSVLDGQGRDFTCEVQSVDRNQVVLTVVEERRIPRPEIEIILVQGIIKRKPMDLIIEKATELGVSRIVAAKCQRSIPGADRSGVKPERWRDLAIVAMKQCGRTWLPEVDGFQSFANVLEDSKDWTVNIVGGLDREIQPLHQVIGSVRGDRGKVRVGIWVGPEGDFSASEYEQMMTAGHRFVSLGENVLRSETAAITALAQVQYELNRSGILATKAGNS